MDAYRDITGLAEICALRALLLCIYCIPDDFLFVNIFYFVFFQRILRRCSSQQHSSQQRRRRVVVVATRQAGVSLTSSRRSWWSGWGATATCGCAPPRTIRGRRRRGKSRQRSSKSVWNTSRNGGRTWKTGTWSSSRRRVGRPASPWQGGTSGCSTASPSTTVSTSHVMYYYGLYLCMWEGFIIQTYF